MSVVEAEAAPSAQMRASGSSFYAAMRILPRAQRDGMFEVYSFCRLVDDIADDGGPQAPRFAQLEQWRQDIDALCAGKIPAPQFAGLAAAIKEFNLQKDDFFAVIDGMEMDVREDIQAPDWQTLDLYCDRRRERGGTAFGPRLRGCRKKKARLSRIISAARCSSPTSCAMSTRMQASTGSICRARSSSPRALRAPIHRKSSPARISPLPARR